MVWSPATDPELQKRKAPATLRKEEFFNRLQSAYGEAARDRMIAIPDSVHDAMKEISCAVGSRCTRRTRTLPEPNLKEKGVNESLPGIGDVSAEESKLISDLLFLYRDRRTPLSQEVVSAMRLLMQAAIARREQIDEADVD